MSGRSADAIRDARKVRAVPEPNGRVGGEGGVIVPHALAISFLACPTDFSPYERASAPSLRKRSIRSIRSTGPKPQCFRAFWWTALWPVFALGPLCSRAGRREGRAERGARWTQR